MDCKHVNDNLVDYIYQELDAEELARIEGHLGECEACARELQAFERTRELMQQLPQPEPSASVTESLLREAGRAARAGAQPGPWERVRMGLRGLVAHPAMAAAVAVVLVLGVSLYAYQRTSPPSRDTLRGEMPAAEVGSPAPAEHVARMQEDREHEGATSGEKRWRVEEQRREERKVASESRVASEPGVAFKPSVGQEARGEPASSVERVGWQGLSTRGAGSGALRKKRRPVRGEFDGAGGLGSAARQGGGPPRAPKSFARPAAPARMARADRRRGRAGPVRAARRSSPVRAAQRSSRAMKETLARREIKDTYRDEPVRGRAAAPSPGAAPASARAPAAPAVASRGDGQRRALGGRAGDKAEDLSGALESESAVARGGRAGKGKRAKGASGAGRWVAAARRAEKAGRHGTPQDDRSRPPLLDPAEEATLFHHQVGDLIIVGLDTHHRHHGALSPPVAHLGPVLRYH